MKIALATCAEYPNLGLDGPTLSMALDERGLKYAPLVWNDPAVEWREWDLCMLHSTWDYHRDTANFLAWAGRVAGFTRLWNPLAAVLWNNHKGYLAELGLAGIPVVPTVWVKTGEKVELGGLLESRGWRRVVIKPGVGASAFGARLVTLGTEADGEAQAHLESLLANGDVMVQPALTSLETYGEHSLIIIDGELTHAVHRASTITTGSGRVAGENSLVTPQAAEIDLAYKALALVRFPLLYARVDIVRDNEGAFRLIELEIIEPGLFLRLYPAAAHRLVEGIIKRGQV